MGQIRIGVDTGGTFTDVVLLPPDGGPPVVHKLLSTPEDPSRAVLDGVRAVLAKARAQVCASEQAKGAEVLDPGNPDSSGVIEIVHGSTVATNALLEGKAGRVAFITTAGFEDLLWLRRQNRPELYAMEPVVPQPPLSRDDCFGVLERIGADGEIITALVDSELDRLLDWLRGLEQRAVVVCLLNSYANPAHELLVAERLRKRFLGVHLTVSSERLPEFREYERAATCLVNAACAGPMLAYLERLGSGVSVQGSRAGAEDQEVFSLEPRHANPGPALRIMASHGGAVPIEAIADVPAQSVLSGPAGGVLGAMAAAKAAGITHFLSYDMGGTSTDVALCNGIPAMAQSSEIAGLPLKLPVLDIHTVGAGGGSVAWVDAGGMLRVGPQSLGADPGPACYGRQVAPFVPSVTDAHVVLRHIPANTRLGGTLELDVEAARGAVGTIARHLSLSIEETASGILRVAAADVARALRRMSVERGEDPRDYCLLPFGGMGGLHAAELAEQLGMKQILLPPHPGLLSAVGMLSAPAKHLYSRSLLIRAHASDAAARISDAASSLRAAADGALEADGVKLDDRRLAWSLDLRYRGQSHEVNVPLGVGKRSDRSALAAAVSAFSAEHLRLYGFAPQAPVEVVTLRLMASGPEPELGLANGEAATLQSSEAEQTQVWEGGGWQSWQRLNREDVTHRRELSGPVLLTEYSATTLIPYGWKALAHGSGALLFQKEGAAATPALQGQNSRSSGQTGPVELALFRHLYASIAEEMGSRLMRSAFSPNIKERRDFSCALFLADGQMLAQAAHIPVHLGSMPLSVAAVLERFPVAAMQAGDVFVVNDPFAGGTHLPDITVVAPVFVDGEAAPQFIVANRAHHADIGGISPGSMPLSRSIDEEGIRLEPQRMDVACIRRICAASRTPEERQGDLNAQIAALTLGQHRIAELVAVHGVAVCKQYALELLNYSERCMHEVLSVVGHRHGPEVTDTGERATLQSEFTDYLDDDGLDGGPIRLHCKLIIENGSAIVDLRACGPQVAGPLNAVHAIAVSAALYCFRCLAQRLLPNVDVPENAGLQRPVTVLTRPGTIADALPPAAVAAGNVETSQRLVDVIFGSMAQLWPDIVPAASGGSMNNVTIGNDRFAYYETLACGAGAGPQGAAAHAVHTHMTNTLNTPVEALEHAYPLRVVRYGIRPESGGAGLHPGGNGIVRRYRALEPCTATVLSERRVHWPWGVNGGKPGACGRNMLYRADGTEQQLGGKFTVELTPGDELEIATPGGGGWGSAA